MKSRGHWSFCTEIFYFENLPWVYGVWISSYEIWNMKWSVSLRSNKHVEGISFLQITSAKMIFIWSFKSCIGPCLMSCSLLLSCLCWCIGKILYILLHQSSMSGIAWNQHLECESSCAYNTNNTATHVWSRTPQGSFNVMQFQKVFCFMVHKFWTPKNTGQNSNVQYSEKLQSSC